MFITGGVVSSVGKGITAASIGRILKSRNIAVTIQKLDPYLNVDPGTMSPYQHGEVFVTKDGAETDLDLGHYERFIDIELTTASSVTTGQIYSSVIAAERRGDFLGGTIQVVPHVTSEIKRRIKEVGEAGGASVVIVEVGGTVGDIEGLPFLEAIRQMRTEVGRDNVLYIHVTLLPYISATGELKTKPTQHSVNELRRIGIQPDIVVCRSDHPVSEGIKDKLALFCSVEKKAVIPLMTVQTIYEVPLILEEAGLGNLMMEMLGVSDGSEDLHEWRALVDAMKVPKEPIPIALVGKYVELKDAYISVREALRHAAARINSEVDIRWVQSEDLEKDEANIDKYLGSVQGILVPGGFGYRGIEGMIKAARYAREREIPYLGLCLGLHVMVVELCRYVYGSEEPNSTEFAPKSKYPVIDLLPEQRGMDAKGGTMRLGAYPCHLVEGSRAAAAYGESVIHERHRHRFEFNNDFRYTLEQAGLAATGLSPDGRLVEIVELKNHPWMVATQFHPEFKSRPDRPHPLFLDFVKASRRTMREGAQHPLPLHQLGEKAGD
ncbi:MAG: CTP synthase [Methanomicrobiales archaeon]|nr:CTP synthase [Methanomicrobiales archaeon]